MEHFIPRDSHMYPGMKTVLADHKEHFAVHYLADQVYAETEDGVKLTYQLLIPNEPQRGLPPEGYRDIKRIYPLVIYVQGSGWGIQDHYGNIPQLSEIARRGYVVASVQHQPSQEIPFHKIVEQIKLAIRYFRANAERFEIDPKRVAIWGDSSGAHGSMMCAVTGDMPEFKTGGYEEYSDAVQAIVDFYGPTDCSKINDAPRRPELLNKKTEGVPTNCPGNPIAYINDEKEFPPFLIMHGDLDSTVPFNQSALIYEKLIECRQTVEFYKVIGASHGTGFWTRQVVGIVGDFLDGILD